MVVTWMAGPAKGISQVAKDGYLPRSWRRTNQAGMPTHILLVQTGLSALLSCAILFMPTVSSAFMLMSALAAQLYLIMYLLMFAAAIRLRYTRPEVHRGYTIPGGKTGIWLVCGVAICACIFVTIFGFIPPTEVSRYGVWASTSYTLFLVSGMALFAGLPLYLHKRAKKRGADDLELDVPGVGAGPALAMEREDSGLRTGIR
jgi:Amino acid transporters